MNLSMITRNPTKFPRTIALRALAVAFMMGGCVPATTYEEATSAAEVEREGHRRAAMRLHAAEEELRRLKAEKDALAAEKRSLEARLAEEETELAQTSLDMESAKKAHEQQSELVTQLRGELARVGDHLKAFQGDKDVLAEKLTSEEAKVKLLEEQLDHLRTKAETSEEEQAKLRAALSDLDKSAQDQGQAAPEGDDSAQEGDEPEEPAAEEPAGAPSEGNEPTEEVLPDEEAPSQN